MKISAIVQPAIPFPASGSGLLYRLTAISIEPAAAVSSIRYACSSTVIVYVYSEYTEYIYSESEYYSSKSIFYFCEVVQLRVYFRYM